MSATTPSDDISCPLCHLVDQVLSVPSVATNETGIVAEKLKMRAKPVYITPWGFWSVSLVIAGLVCGVIVLLGSLYTSISGGLLTYIEACLIFFVPVALIFWWKIRTASARRAEVAIDLPLWIGEMEQWSKLYYCRRDDTVWDPKNKAE